MKVKTLKLLTAGIVFGMGVVAVAGVAANGGLVSNLFQSQADASRSFTITSAQIIDAMSTQDKTFSAGGLTWQIGGKYKTVGDNVYFGDGWVKNTTASGATDNGEKRGGGFLSFDITKVSANAGVNVFVYDFEEEQLGEIILGSGISGDGQSSKSFNYDDEASFIKFNFGGNATAAENDTGTVFSQIQLTYQCVDK